MTPNPSTIHFIITGGTIDSHYDGSKDTVVTNKESTIPAFIKSLKLYNKTEFTTICMKDSRELKNEDLKNIVKTVEKSPHQKIIVTHGTYTMPDSARFLKAKLKRADQTIIFTGSTIPIAGFAPSDGPFNLGYAIAQLQHLKPGIYVSMNGKIFSPQEVMKVMSEARFASIFQK